MPSNLKGRCAKILGTRERRNALASYENVVQEVNRRLARHLQPVASP